MVGRMDPRIQLKYWERSERRSPGIGRKWGGAEVTRGGRMVVVGIIAQDAEMTGCVASKEDVGICDFEGGVISRDNMFQTSHSAP